MSHPTPKSKKFKDIKAIIFDWSGVISDDRKPVYEANKAVLDKYGVPHEDFKTWLLNAQGAPATQFASKGITTDSAILTEEYRISLEKSKQDGIHPVIYLDIVDIIEKLANIKKLFVVSSHPEDHLRLEAQDYGIDKYFSLMLGSIKDKAIAIEGILKSIKISPSSAMYVGDMVFDIRAAKRAGVISVGVSTGYHTKEQLLQENPDILIESLSELLNYV